MLQERLLAWLQLQAGEVKNPGYKNGSTDLGIEPDPSRGGAAVSKTGASSVSIQSGTIAEIFAGGVHESYFLELRWVPGMTRSGNCVMLSAADLAEGRVPLEVGKPAELPGSEVGPPNFSCSSDVGHPVVLKDLRRAVEDSLLYRD